MAIDFMIVTMNSTLFFLHARASAGFLETLMPML